MKRASNCKSYGEKLNFSIIRNRKYWVYGTITFVGFIFGFVLLVILKLAGLILGLLFEWYIWHWYTQKVDYVGYCKKCGH